jgi:membrane associated rhomboid family serine protease
MAILQGREKYFEIPHTAVYLLIAANIIAYGVCVSQSGTLVLPTELLFRSGAMYPLAIDRHEYWRLIAYGFLHADLFHLTINLLCLVLWGGHLEKRIGSFYFLVIFVGALILGAIVSNFTHSGRYLAVGASGGISGILGALLCLWILGKIELTATFFVANIGLNAALAFGNSNIDWAAHLGGFAAGLIACALLDVLERAMALVFRCKFPEFVKINGSIVLGGLAILVWASAAPSSAGQVWWLAYTVVCLAVLKSIDMVLWIKKGLAIIVVAFAVTNAALVWFVIGNFGPAFASHCELHFLPAAIRLETLLRAACANPDFTRFITSVCALGLTGLLCWREFYRGINDVGFVGASLHAEHNRRRGI